MNAIKGMLSGFTVLTATVACLAACSSSSNGPAAMDGGGDASTDGAVAESGTDGAAMDSGTDGAAMDSGTDAAPQPIPDAGACTSTADVAGSWEAAGTAGVTVTLVLNGDGTFTEGDFVETAPGTFDEEEFTGNYMVSGGLLTLTTQDLTCPVGVGAYIAACGVADGDLFLEKSGTIVAFAPYTTPADAGAITLGCGNPFKPYPLMANN